MRKKRLPKKERLARIELAENAFLTCATCPYAGRLVIPKKMPILSVRCKKSKTLVPFKEANACPVRPTVGEHPDEE